MEVYVLDEVYRRIRVIDTFQSLIWADRMTAVGDFEMVIFSTPVAKRQLVSGVRLAMNESDKIMTIETVEDKTDDQGLATLKITGRSLETTLDNRLALASLSDSTSVPKWVLTGHPADIARQIFHDICVTGTISAQDILPLIVEGDFQPTSLIAEPTDTVTYEISPTSVYQALKTICDQYQMGFGLFRNYDNQEIYFTVFMGNDRTTAQTTFRNVVFSPALGNLQNTSELSSSALYKNVAYVISPVGAEEVYAPDVDTSVAGYERSVLLVLADDITDTDPPTATALMVQRGLTELSKNRMVSAFDGELSQSSGYVPNLDYYVGDLIEVRSASGSTDIMQVIEQIYISDENGPRRYPTLQLYNFITPGSWGTLPTTETWADVGGAVTWDDFA